MGLYTGLNLISDGLVMCYDPGNSKSYPGSGSAFNNLGSDLSNGTVFGGSSFNSDSSITFNGNQMLQHNSNLSLDYMTVSIVFVRNGTDSAAGEDILFNKENVWEMKTNSNSLEWAVYANNQSWFWYAVQNITNGVKYHVCLSYDGGAVYTYVNGVLVQTYDYPDGGVLNKPNTFPKFNSRGTGSGAFSNVGNHKMYHWSVYSRALSPSEIRRNYDALATRFGL